MITAAASETKAFQRKQLVELNNQAIVNLQKNGMAVNEVSAGEIAKLRAKAVPVIEKYAKELSPGLMQKANADIASVRK